MRGALVTLQVAILLAAAPAGAQELRHNWLLDGSVTGEGAAMWVSLEILKPNVPCRWCAANSFDTGARSALKWCNPHAAATTSDVLLFGGVPALAIGADALAAVHDARGRGIGVDALVIVEAAMLAADVNQITKLVFARERPCAHFRENEKEPRPCNAPSSDDNVSFFSGHTSVTMALAVASGTVAQMRGYRWAPMVWATLPALSLFTGYLRVAADKHWLTDVLTGAVLGAAIGAGVPYIFHRPDVGESAPTTAGASPLLAPVAVGGAW